MTTKISIGFSREELVDAATAAVAAGEPRGDSDHVASMVLSGLEAETGRSSNDERDIGIIASALEEAWDAVELEDIPAESDEMDALAREFACRTWAELLGYEGEVTMICGAADEPARRRRLARLRAAAIAAGMSIWPPALPEEE